MVSLKGSIVSALLLLSLLAFAIQSTHAYADCPECGICQNIYKPVCGADGVTYGNACHLGCEKTCRKPGLKVAHDGECGNPVVYPPHK